MYHQPSKDTMKLSLGFCSIYKESFNIISSNRKLFTQFALFLALPVSIFTAISTPLSSFLFPNIDIGQQITSSINNNYSSAAPSTSTTWTIIAAFLAFKLAYIVLCGGLSLLCFSSVTYSVACIYTEHTDITFVTALSAFKKVWKNLVLTSLAELVVIFGYFLVTGLLLVAAVFWSVFWPGQYEVVGSLATLIIVCVMTGGIIYISIVMIFGKTVANLDTIYGFEALSKSKSLIKGKVRPILRVFVPVSACSGVVAWIFLKVVVNGSFMGLVLVTRIGCGVACLPVMAGLNVFGVVVLTVTYLVCKADKEERIMKSDVMDHLEIFVDGYSPLKRKDEEI